MSVHMEQLGSNGKDFREILHLRIFRKSVDKTSIFITMWQEYWVVYTKAYVHLG